MDQNNQVYDLRSALNLLRSQPGQLVPSKALRFTSSCFR